MTAEVEDSMSRRSSSSPSLWTVLPQRGPAPCDRYKHACCSYGGNVFVLGGRESHSLRDFWRYSVVHNEWTELDCSCEAAPEELQEHSMVAYEGFLYVFGGMIDSAYTKWRIPFWVFDIVKEQWVYWQGKRNPPHVCTVMERSTYQEKHNQVPVNRKGHSAVVFGSAMYIYGGYIDMIGSSQEFWKFDFDTMLWSLLDCIQMEVGPGPRHSHSAMIHLDCMYLFGGLRGLREQRDLWRWNCTSYSWSCLKAMSGPSKLVGHSAVVYRDSMLLFGGGESQHTPRSCLWRYSFANRTWGKLAVLPSSSPPPQRIHHCCAGLGPSYQPAVTTTTSTALTPSITIRKSLDSNLRPFKNKCFPSSSALEGTIELETFSSSEKLKLGNYCNGLNGNFLTFANQEAFSKQCSCEEIKEGGSDKPEASHESIAQHLPDLLLVLGGKPLARHAAISVWQMTLADL